MMSYKPFGAPHLRGLMVTDENGVLAESGDPR